MADYSKWDHIVDSSDEEKERRERKAQEAKSIEAEEKEKEIELQVEIDRWLKRQVAQVQKDQEAKASRPPELTGSAFSPRIVNDEERKVLAMLMVTAHFEVGNTNILKHHDIFELTRKHRWIEEDPGTLELLCIITRNVTQKGASLPHSGPGIPPMHDRMVSILNLLAAPTKAGCNPGYGKVFELFALIGDPKTKKAWDVREKYNKKEYAAEAMFDSLLDKDELSDLLPKRNYIRRLCLVLTASIFFIAWFIYMIFTGQHSTDNPSLEKLKQGDL